MRKVRSYTCTVVGEFDFPLNNLADDIREAKTLAEANYPEAAKKYVELMAQALRKRTPIETPLFLEFVDCLDRIAAGEDPSTVFLLQLKQRGRKRSLKTLEADHELADRVYRYHKGNKLPLRANSTSDGAFEQAAADFKTTPASAEAAFKLFRPPIHQLYSGKAPDGQEQLPFLLKARRKRGSQAPE